MRLLNRSGWIAIKTEHHRRFCKTFFVPSSIPPRVIAGARLWLPRQRKTTHPRVTIGGKLPTGNESFVRPRKKPIGELHPSKVWEGHLVKQKSLTEKSEKPGQGAGASGFGGGDRNRGSGGGSGRRESSGKRAAPGAGLSAGSGGFGAGTSAPEDPEKKQRQLAGLQKQYQDALKDVSKAQDRLRALGYDPSQAGAPWNLVAWPMISRWLGSTTSKSSLVRSTGTAFALTC